MRVCPLLPEVKMITEQEKQRYSRQIQLENVGIDGQRRLKEAKVLVIGAGGLGCPVLAYLAASGVGEIKIVDGDVVGESNLPRQILYTSEDVFNSKAKTAAYRIRALNPFVQVTFLNQYLDKFIALEIFDKYDIVVDCTDNLETRYLINDVCRYYDKPYVSAAIYKHEGQIGVYNVKGSLNDFSANIADLFPQRTSANVLNCSEIGVLSPLPGIIGSIQANEVLKYFLDKETCLINKMLCINTRTMESILFNIEARSYESAKSKEEILAYNYVIPCNNLLPNFCVKDILNKKSTVLVDVRELDEQPKINNIFHLRIPLKNLEDQMEKLRGYERVLFFCKSGLRSKMAVEIVKKNESTMECLSYNKGVEALINELELNATL